MARNLSLSGVISFVYEPTFNISLTGSECVIPFTISKRLKCGLFKICAAPEH